MEYTFTHTNCFPILTSLSSFVQFILFLYENALICKCECVTLLCYASWCFNIWIQLNQYANKWNTFHSMLNIIFVYTFFPPPPPLVSSCIFHCFRGHHTTLNWYFSILLRIFHFLLQSSYVTSNGIATERKLWFDGKQM